MRRLRWFLVGLVVGTSVASGAAAPWHHDLSQAGGGYWRCRAAVSVANRTGVDVAGRAVQVRVGKGAGQLGLIGHGVASLRVCDAQGGELLYDLVDAGGRPRREGKLEEGDRLAFGVECKDGGAAVYYVYADNPAAAAVAEFLRAGAAFANGGFEEGVDAPARWAKQLETDQHRLSWVSEAPHSGRRCIRCDVAPGAPATWVKWHQRGIAVEPNAEYRLEGWLKARGVKGDVAWFIHVHGKEPQAVNQSGKGGGGTYGWQRVAFTFRTPPDAASADVGTILRGTGTAWYDDVRLTLLTKRTPLSAAAAKVERFVLAELPALPAWRHPKASHRVELRVRNWRRVPARPVVEAQLAPLLRRLPPRLRRRPALRLVDPATGKRVGAFITERRLLFPAELPPKSERVYHLYVRESSPAERATRQKAAAAQFAGLVTSQANRIVNPGFEQGAGTPEDWTLSAQSELPPERLHRGARDRNAHGGKWCVRLDIPPKAALHWSGWHQDVPVGPLTTYLFGAYVRCRDVDGSVQIHGHFRDADGTLCKARPFCGVGPGLSRTQPWTLLLGTVRTPADCSTLQIHLTMNAHGTVWHDDVLLCEASTATMGETEARQPLDDPIARRRGYAVWSVNPIVKVFRHDLAGPEPRRIELAAARNEFEPFQLALRAAKPLRQVAVRVEPPRHSSGRVLDDVALNLVGYVAIDHPSSYYRSDVPPWYRKRPPSVTSGCDGWPGPWPDPLPPFKPFDLGLGTTQPVWGTVRVPADAAPGVYRGAVVITPANAPELRLPLVVRVWNFALPKRTTLEVIYDFRERYTRMFGGARGTRDEVLRKWHDFLAARRISPGLLPSPRFTYADGKVAMATADFDRHASHCLDTLGMSAFYSPWFLYAFGWAHKPRRIFGLEPFTDEYKRAYTQCLKLYMDHLRKKGWAERVVLYVSDEPHFTKPGIEEQMIDVCTMIRSVEPKIRIYSSTWRHVPAWHGHINLWGIGAYGCFPVETMRERLAAGDSLWFTTDGQMCLDTPYCAIERLQPWYCRKYGVAGYEFWGVNWWTYDPWDRGWHRFISQSSDGETYFHVRYPNGDGYLTYPGARVGVDGPVSSVRLEQAREGIEDYEYFVLLDRLLARAKARGIDTRGAEAARDAALALVSIPNRGGRYSTALLPDPDAVPRLRAGLAVAIEGLAAKLK